MRLPCPAILPAMLILPGIAAAQTAPPATLEPLVPAAGTVLDVSAEGRTTRVPDLATIRAGVTTQAATAAEALSSNADRMARVLAALRRAGVAERDVQSSTVQLQPQYRYADNQPPVITGYQGVASVSIRFRDVKRAGTILDTLVREGANQIDGPSLSIAQPDAALDEARTQAVAKARAKADLYARAAGLRVIRIVSIAEAGQDAGGPDRPVMPMMMRTKAADAATEIAPGERDIGVTLSVRFLLG